MCPLINEPPFRARPLSFVPSLFRLYGFIRSLAGCKLELHCKKQKTGGFWGMKGIAFIFVEQKEAAEVGR